MSELALKEAEIVESFYLFDDWLGRYEYLIERGKTLEVYDEALKDEAHLVRGCQSRVWIQAECREGRVYFKGDSDAQITKGLVALLINVLSGATAEEIITARLDFLDQIGLREHLSPTRKNGLAGMVRLMKQHALGCLNPEVRLA